MKQHFNKSPTRAWRPFAALTFRKEINFNLSKINVSEANGRQAWVCERSETGHEFASVVHI
jgi:hypothetical protein